MPSCFQLYKKDDKSNNAAKLTEVDEHFCRDFLKREPSERKWGACVFDWYNSIGFLIATTDEGLGSEQLRRKVYHWCYLPQNLKRNSEDRLIVVNRHEVDKETKKEVLFFVKALKWFEKNYNSDCWSNWKDCTNE